MFLEKEIFLLTSEEAKKIQAFVELLDKQIQIEKDKLEAIKQVKKGLLQQMFVWGGAMPRQKKDGVNINYFIRRDVKEKLDAYCEDVGQTATMAIERILDDYLTKYMADKESASEGENKADTAK